MENRKQNRAMPLMDWPVKPIEMKAEEIRHE
jgi:hypothetical protein